VVKNDWYYAEELRKFLDNLVVMTLLISISIYLSIGINVRFAAMMADVGDGLL